MMSYTLAIFSMTDFIILGTMADITKKRDTISTDASGTFSVRASFVTSH